MDCDHAGDKAVAMGQGFSRLVRRSFRTVASVARLCRLKARAQAPASRVPLPGRRPPQESEPVAASQIELNRTPIRNSLRYSELVPQAQLSGPSRRRAPEPTELAAEDVCLHSSEVRVIRGIEEFNPHFHPVLLVDRHPFTNSRVKPGKAGAVDRVARNRALAQRLPAHRVPGHLLERASVQVLVRAILQAGAIAASDSSRVA